MRTNLEFDPDEVTTWPSSQNGPRCSPFLFLSSAALQRDIIFYLICPSKLSLSTCNVSRSRRAHAGSGVTRKLRTRALTSWLSHSIMSVCNAISLHFSLSHSSHVPCHVCMFALQDYAYMKPHVWNACLLKQSNNFFFSFVLPNLCAVRTFCFRCSALAVNPLAP